MILNFSKMIYRDYPDITFEEFTDKAMKKWDEILGTENSDSGGPGQVAPAVPADSVSVSGQGPGQVVPDEGVPHCFSCKKDVQTTSLGKYCVRFGSDIKQFCSIVSLDDYMKGLKVCSYCQKDISGGEGFLAPIGENGQFKDFCEQSCLQNYEHMHLGRLVWT
jgi:ribosomal protein L24E